MTDQSVELRVVTRHDPDECTCGKVYQLGTRPAPGCLTDIVSDFGTIEYPRPDLTITYNYETEQTVVTADNVAPIVLVSREFADDQESRAQAEGTAATERSVSTFYTLDGRRFMRIDADNGSWTWELFDAHWADGEHCNVLIGRWPD